MILLTSCGGSAIGNAQEFVPNEPPLLVSFSAVLAPESAGIDVNSLVKDVIFNITIQGIDPEGETLDFEFTSDFGIFGGKKISGNTCEIIFVTNENVKSEIPVTLNVSIIDPIGDKYTAVHSVGKGKNKAVLEIHPDDLAKTCSNSGTTSIRVKADCIGYYQVICDNAALAGTLKMDDLEKIYLYKKSGATFDYVTVTISGLSSAVNSDVKLKLNSAPNNIWIIFCDYINDDISVKSVVTAVP
ncbi:MAG TPA: hypothetical protein PLA54_06705 [Spirochaetota bacterium]|nr:hypothetical protein [Spirochaetota bacterium]HQE58871.1 hypothetical protein [Spirochaetota bacterium]